MLDSRETAMNTSGVMEVAFGRDAAEGQAKRAVMERLVVPAPFDSPEELEERLSAMAAAEGGSLEALSGEGFAAYGRRRGARAVAFCAANMAELRAQISDFMRHRQKWMQPEFRWQTEKGSYYTASPAGRAAKVCFVSPPSGMTAEQPVIGLCSMLPALREDFHKIGIDAQTDVRIHEPLSRELLSELLAVFALERLGLPCHAVLGASMGEINLPLLLDLTNVPRNADVLLPGGVLDGFYDLLRRMGDSQAQRSLDFFGRDVGPIESWLLNCGPEDALRGIQAEGPCAPVFLTVVSSPREVIVCGAREACGSVISRLGCFAAPLEEATYFHTPVMEPWREELRRIILSRGIHLRDGLPVAVYSGGSAARLGSGAEELADSQADALLKRADLPAALRRAYDDGCRVFIDLTSKNLCCRWLNQTFAAEPSVLAASLFEKSDAGRSLLWLFTRLLSNGVGFDCGRFFDAFEWRCGEPERVKKMAPGPVLEEFARRQLDHNLQAYDGFLACQRFWLGRIARGTVRTEAKKPLFEYADILEMTAGSMAKVLGTRYAKADGYAVRARMPLPPYLFVSRIAAIDAQYGQLRPGSSVTAEFDVSEDCVLRIHDGAVANVVFCEAGHLGIFLAAYMGIDERMGGRARFRIADASMVYYGEASPRIGQTVRLSCSFDRFVETGDALLIYSTFTVRYADGAPFFEARELGGFFSEAALRSGGGIKTPFAGRQEETCRIYRPISERKAFGRDEVHAFLRGDFFPCFGVRSDPAGCIYRVTEKAMFLDRITDVSLEGGPHGLGSITGEQDVDEDFWAFSCHFKNDPVFPATIMLEGVNQAAWFFEVYAGLQKAGRLYEPRTKTDVTMRCTFRGEVTPGRHTMRYCVYPRRACAQGEDILFALDAEVFCDGVAITRQENLTVLIGKWGTEK